MKNITKLPVTVYMHGFKYKWDFNMKIKNTNK
jgi:hypothetical protein